MKYVQMLPVLSEGDAIGNNVFAMDSAMREAGLDTQIYCGKAIGETAEKRSLPFSEYEDRTDNVVIYHLSTGSRMNNQIMDLNARVILVYHNITPPEFFHDYNARDERACRNGLRQAKMLSGKPVMCLTESEFNRQDLIRMGYKCPIEVLPLLIRFSDYEKEPDEAVIKKYRDGFINILFTGRFAPNKRQDELIRDFYYYHQFINSKSRLILVGGFDQYGAYYRRLTAYIEALGISDSVIIPGHIPFAEVLAYYRVADVFLCLSEHEGFCVPLVEAMYFHVPIIAFDSTAIAGTLGGSGILLEDKRPEIVAETINYLMKHEDVRRELVAGQDRRLTYFDNDRIKKEFLEILRKYVG